MAEATIVGRMISYGVNRVGYSAGDIASISAELGRPASATKSGYLNWTRKRPK